MNSKMAVTVYHGKSVVLVSSLKPQKDLKQTWHECAMYCFYCRQNLTDDSMRNLYKEMLCW
jgi:hypothetical protein